MMVSLDITGEDIAQLSDGDLRRLIGELCEADYERAGLSRKGIRWGGHQDAKDGGLDVVVDTAVAPPPDGFIPRRNTGFQVKKSDMQPAKIREEMCPKGVLREEIRTLIEKKGAYIIVSGGGSTTESALKRRLAAMKMAIGDEDKDNGLALDFFDQGQVASWVRAHPVYVMWVRNRVGRQLTGWQEYGNWANGPGGVEEEYLMDDGLRLHGGTGSTQEGITVEQGIENVRAALYHKGSSIRLAGLSGVGKTRLVQALFDGRIGKKPLNRHQVFYTDIADSPVPNPGDMVRQLIAGRTRALVIVDNCPPDLHRRLTEISSDAYSTVSVLTVEYDVREDVPEETSVYRLEPASTETIEKIISRRFEQISQVDCRTIAEFSGGNARIAIALANTIRGGETLSGFHEEQLFQRLFEQRHGSDEGLSRSAEACALVYSFDGIDVSSVESELNVLARLVGRTGDDLYRDVTKLKERDLVQARSRWRAVLPHAIANRLARRALEVIPRDKIVRTFLDHGSERLVKSFARRLGYLHDSHQAQEIVENWLREDGWLGEGIGSLNRFGMEIFAQIAPVAPLKTLETIERAVQGDAGDNFCSKDNPHASEFIEILRHLSYEPEFFERSVKIILRFTLAEEETREYSPASDVLKSLFGIYLSGTHATPRVRARVLEELLESDRKQARDLGLILLRAALETWHFGSVYEFNFGARSRDFGYHPETGQEILAWYRLFMDMCVRIAISESSIAEDARQLFADSLRGLWARGGMFDDIEKAAKQIHGKKAWNEGWIAVKGIIRYDADKLDKSLTERLYHLESYLRPRNLLQKARAFVLSKRDPTFELEDVLDENDADLGRAEMETRRIGRQVAEEQGLFETLLPELVSTNNHGLYAFGKGLADSSSNKSALWAALYGALKDTSEETRQIRIMLGFLNACRTSDPRFYNDIMDSVVTDDMLGKLLPVFATTSTIDARGVERLHEGLDVGNADVENYRYLSFGRAHESIPDDDLAELLYKVNEREGGNEVAIDILRMRFHRRKEEEIVYSEGLLALTREILSGHDFARGRRRQGSRDHELARLTSVSMRGSRARDAGQVVCERFIEAIDGGHIYDFDYPELLGALAETQPFLFLDKFVGNIALQDHRKMHVFRTGLMRAANPLDQIADKDLIAWCEVEPEARYAGMTRVLEPFTKRHEVGPYEWKPVVYRILERAPELDVVLDNFSRSLRPMSWSGSRAAILQSRAILFEKLLDHENVEVQSWARSQRSLLQEESKEERRMESRYERDRNESFE